MNTYLPSEAELSDAFAFLILAVVAVAILWGVRYVLGKSVASLALLAGVGFIGLLFLVRTQSSVRVQVANPRVFTEQRTDVSVSTPLTASKPSTPSPPTSAIQQLIGSNAPISITELPSWVKNPPHEGTLGAGYCKYVITSQLFATPEEAEAELNKQLAVDVQQSFTVGDSPAVGWSPTADDLHMSGLVTEKVIETVPMKVGEFDTTVHRVSWLVEFKPASQQALLSQWQVGEAQRRSKLILSAIATISGVMGVSAFMLRKQQTPTTPATAQVA